MNVAEKKKKRTRKKKCTPGRRHPHLPAHWQAFTQVSVSARDFFSGACPTDVLEMVVWEDCRAGQIASAPRTEDCVGCKRCESACPTDFLSIRVYLGGETTRSMGLAY